jgi:glycosyltransferase involved in cell wall biosynthesis
MLVSICSIAYNQETFISQAIDSWLMQKCDFEIEIVIGEDSSTDTTRKIIEEYSLKHSGIIRVIESEENVGMMPNFIRTLKACKGKYIALCEGDDYWADPYKLQKQVDFLEANNEVAISFHNSIIEYTKTDSKELFHKRRMPVFFSGTDLLKHWLIPTASAVIRNVVPDIFPTFFIKATHGDLALFLYISQFGKIAMFHEVMSVYRINESGVTNNFKGIKHNLAHIEQCQLMKDYFKPNHQKLLSKRIANYYLSTARLSAKIGKKRNAIVYFSASIFNYPKIIISDFLSVFKLFFELIIPLKNG